MSRRRRAAQEKALRLRVTRAKEQRRKTRGGRRTAAVAVAAALTLAGVGPVAATVPVHRAATSLAPCSDLSTPASDPSQIVDADGTLFFTAYDGVHGRELWTSDGTAAGTVLVKDIMTRGGYYTGLYDLTPVGDTLFFNVQVDGHGELWKSDGTEAGTVLVKDIEDLAPLDGRDTYPSQLTAAGDLLFFATNDGLHGQELWKSDGTEAGTTLVEDISEAYGDGVDELTATGETLFFTVGDGVHGRELWKSDGTAAGTVLVKDVRPGKHSQSRTHLTAVGDTVYFRARDGVHGEELWKSDGTEAGTVLVANIGPGARGSSPDDLIDVDGRLFFTADDDVHGQELWTSDGTESGTVLVKDLDAENDNASGMPEDMFAAGSTLFFTSDDGIHGRELWRSDGTAAGTVLVKDIDAGTPGSGPSAPAAVGDTLFFRADDGVHGYMLWKSDGTESGTVVVKDLSPSGLVDVDGRLFLSGSDGTYGSELWTSDGTEAGTTLVKDINSGGVFHVVGWHGITPNTRRGTVDLRFFVDAAGRFEVAPAGGSLIRESMRDLASEGMFTVTLRPTRAGRRQLERTGVLRVRARLTFTTCGGNVTSAVERYTLRMK